jgi:purine-nucleoside/S-methyl-5'-thioadenosine phosphorylase / adenosine deaminase
MATTARTAPIKLPAPFQWSNEHLMIDLPGARALFTTRRGGFSKGAFASLNLGRLTADDPDAVDRNRALVQAHVAGRLAMIRQVHGKRVVRVTALEQASGPTPRGELEEADGQASALRGIAPIVLTADCLPIALAGTGGVAMLHAGWRGLAEGIIEEGVCALQELGSEPHALTAAIGPGAGACCYEVGEEVHEHFRSYGRSARRGQNLDLKVIARARLAAAGISTVHDVGLCTICSPPSLFFSHRRDRGVTGRQGGLIWLT